MREAYQIKSKDIFNGENWIIYNTRFLKNKKTAILVATYLGRFSLVKKTKIKTHKFKNQWRKRK
jgi:hypothetical protein